MSNEVEIVYAGNCGMISKISAAIADGKTVIIRPPANKCGTCGASDGHLSSCPWVLAEMKEALSHFVLCDDWRAFLHDGKCLAKYAAGSCKCGGNQRVKCVESAIKAAGTKLIGRSHSDIACDRDAERGTGVRKPWHCKLHHTYGESEPCWSCHSAIGRMGRALERLDEINRHKWEIDKEIAGVIKHGLGAPKLKANTPAPGPSNVKSGSRERATE